jgi:hypothetical protein
MLLSEGHFKVTIPHGEEPVSWISKSLNLWIFGCIAGMKLRPAHPDERKKSQSTEYMFVGMRCGATNDNPHILASERRNRRVNQGPDDTWSPPINQKINQISDY